MSANREHHDDTPPTGPDTSLSKPTAGTDAGRRRFLQAGLGAAPVILTLTSKPAFAQTMDRSAIESMTPCTSVALPGCTDEQTTSLSSLRSYYSPTPSRRELRNFGTNTASTANTETIETASTSTSFGSELFLESYSGPVFATIFGRTWGPESGRRKWSGDERFGDVLWMNSRRDPQDFGKLLVAAYVNASAGTYRLDLTQVVTMGQRALAGEPYYLSPDSSVYWTRDQCIKFLTNTIPA